MGNWLEKTFNVRNILWKKRGIWLRAIICFAIAWFILHVEESENYDLRYAARGQQVISNKVVLVNVPEDHVGRGPRHRPTIYENMSKQSIGTDFWDRNFWAELLTGIYINSPQSVVVTPFFTNDNRIKINKRRYQIFFKPGIYWTARLDNEGKVHAPLFSNDDRSNIGIGNLIFDPDQKVRRFSIHKNSSIPHIADLATSTTLTESMAGNPLPIINYRGKKGTFTTYEALDIISGKVDLNLFKGKIVIIGSIDSRSRQIMTPMGSMARAEVLANVIENIVQNQWIQRMPWYWYGLYILLVLVLAVSIMTRYPQTIALVFMIWVGTALIALSLWTFDTYNFWLPVISVTTLLFAVFILFVSYHLAIQEKVHWKFTQEAKTAQELEQLKNNFVSLFSHDLKTPIAKIQAIVDRLMVQGELEKHQDDLVSLRKSSNELFNYIQKILQVTRVESKKFKLKKDIADLNEIVENVIQQTKPLAREKNLSVEFQSEPLFTVDLDSTLIQEVVLNLIDNAIKYTGDGGKIFISTRETEDGVEFVIADSGDGISPDEQRKIWSKFYRASKHDLNTKGSGLGLYLVKYFIELHGGEISLSSAVGEGTTIRFTIPFEMKEHTNVYTQTSSNEPENESSSYEAGWQ